MSLEVNDIELFASRSMISFLQADFGVLSGSTFSQVRVAGKEFANDVKLYY